MEHGARLSGAVGPSFPGLFGPEDGPVMFPLCQFFCTVPGTSSQRGPRGPKYLIVGYLEFQFPYSES